MKRVVSAEDKPDAKRLKVMFRKFEGYYERMKEGVMGQSGALVGGSEVKEWLEDAIVQVMKIEKVVRKAVG